jgi:hypothetical protein
MELRKLHNLMLNCSSPDEMKQWLINVTYNNRDKVDWVESALKNPSVAANCSILPIYYLVASKTSGMKQDRFGKWYKGE